MAYQTRMKLAIPVLKKPAKLTKRQATEENSDMKTESSVEEVHANILRRMKNISLRR